MLRFSFCPMLALLIAISGAPAFEVKARIKKVDREQGILVFAAGGQDRTAKVAPDAKFFDGDGKDLAGGLKSDRLQEGAEAVLTVERVEDKPAIKAIRIGNPMGKGASMPTSTAAPLPPQDTSALKSLTDMGPNDEYHGAKGGLYPDASNERPAVHTKAGLELAKQIQPLDADGKPSPEGKIVLLAIGFSNTVQAFGGLMQAAEKDKDLNPRLALVNGAQGGRSAFMIKNPDDHSIGEEYWKTWVPDHLKSAGATAARVQAIWLKETDASLPPATQEALGVENYVPPLKMEFPKSAQTLESELEMIVRAMPRFFPNLKLVYVSSRSYGGWALREGNREPFSYETGFAVKWLIEKQIKGDPALNYDAAKGKVEAPWLSWGPYLWANGDRPRKDAFSFTLEDYRENDRMHYSPQGQIKIGNLMLRFFKTDATSKSWFLGKSAKEGE